MKKLYLVLILCLLVLGGCASNELTGNAVSSNEVQTGESPVIPTGNQEEARPVATGHKARCY